MRPPPVPPGRETAIDAMAPVVDGEPSVYVPGGARMLTQGRADAFIRIDPAEHARRQSAGMTAVTQLWMASTLMNLPLGEAIPLDSLARDEQWAIDRLPRGAIARDATTVTRLCRPVSTIATVVLWHDHLPTALTRLAPFHRVATRILVMTAIPTDFDQIAWQASYQGVGVWTLTARGAAEVIPAEPYTPRYYRPARWVITDYAYRTWLTASKAHHG